MAAKTLESFLKAGKANEQWSLSDNDWETTTEEAGLVIATANDDEDTDALSEGQIRFWFSTNIDSIWLVEVRMIDGGSLVKRYLQRGK
jgi:hypothetical protein